MSKHNYLCCLAINSLLSFINVRLISVKSISQLQITYQGSVFVRRIINTPPTHSETTTKRSRLKMHKIGKHLCVTSLLLLFSQTHFFPIYLSFVHDIYTKYILVLFENAGRFILTKFHLKFRRNVQELINYI